MYGSDTNQNTSSTEIDETLDTSESFESESKDLFHDKYKIIFITLPFLIVLFISLINFFLSIPILLGDNVILFILISIFMYLFYQLYLEQEIIISHDKMKQLPNSIQVHICCGLDGKCKIKRRNFYGRH